MKYVFILMLLVVGAAAGLGRARREKSTSGAMQLQKYMVQSAHAYESVTFQKSEAFSMCSPL